MERVTVTGLNTFIVPQTLAQIHYLAARIEVVIVASAGLEQKIRLFERKAGIGFFFAAKKDQNCYIAKK